MQTPGHYRTEPAARAGALSHAAPAMPWKRFLYPPHERLWRAHRSGDDFTIEAGEPDGDERALALLAMHPCDLAAIAVLDAVLANGSCTADGRYRARRQRAVVIAADCSRACDTCFCASMGTGPRAGGGFDLVLSEIPAPAEGGEARLLVAAGTERGLALLDGVDRRMALPADRAAAEAATAAVASTMTRTMPADIAAVLAGSLEAPQWNEVAGRCLGCANCTMVCPTCFCATVEDTTDLAGDAAERTRAWDSCFTLEHSYIHGGGIRTSAAARYRQWMSHKLGFWHGQFGMSGCVGCGRCLTWCRSGST